MARHWTAMLFGRSYWHAPQGRGRAFVPGELRGYYNDLVAKTRWAGAEDDRGLPLNIANDGRRFLFPTTVIQKGIGHWDQWLQTSAARDREQVLRTANWLLESADARGGWLVWQPLGLEMASPYSAMTQGEGASLLVRAAEIAPHEGYVDVARQAIDLMTTPVELGGTAWRSEGELVLDEAPEQPRNVVLNGWISALFGLYDLALIDSGAQEALRLTVASLERWLPRFDAGYWSYYDEAGNLASPFYHRLHVAQLRALAETGVAQAMTFDAFADGLASHDRSSLRRSRAVLTKAWQKILNPPPAVLR